MALIGIATPRAMTPGQDLNHVPRINEKPQLIGGGRVVSENRESRERQAESYPGLRLAAPMDRIGTTIGDLDFV
jgi:hypothetical protein